MNFRIHSFRNAEIIFQNDSRFIHLWNDIVNVLSNITDEDIILEFNSSNRTSKKSISDAIGIVKVLYLMILSIDLLVKIIHGLLILLKKKLL